MKRAPNLVNRNAKEYFYFWYQAVMWYFINVSFKRIIVFLSSLIFSHLITSGQTNYRTFSFYYSFNRHDSAGLIQPVIKANGTKLMLIYDKDCYKVEKVNRTDTIAVGTIRQSSLDSIYHTLSEYKDINVYESIPCILGFGIHSMVIVFNQDTTKLIQNKTYHRAYLKIAGIINQYLPKDKQIWPTEQWLIDCENWQKVLKKWE